MVLIEAISVVVKRAAIEARMAGGWFAFQALVPNATSCTDGELARVGFMTPDDVEAFVSALVMGGMRFRDEGQAADIAVVDQLRGATLPCAWLDIRRVGAEGGQVVAASLLGGAMPALAVPEGWTFMGSLSCTHGFVPDGAMDKALDFLRHENGVDVYRSRLTGEEVYVGRSGTAGGELDDTETGEAMEEIASRALALEGEAETARANADDATAARIFSELHDDLLPRARDLAVKPGRHGAFAAFCVGLVLRILWEYEEAIVWQERALQLQADSLNALLELTACLGQLGRDEAALSVAQRAVQSGPDSAAAWGNLAMCLIQATEWNAARAAIDRALELDPADAKNQAIREAYREQLG